MSLPMWGKLGGEKALGSEDAELVTVFAHLIVKHKELAGEAFVVEIVRQITHRLF